jgi:hypothetical protein
LSIWCHTAPIFVSGDPYVRGMGSSALEDKEAMLAALTQMETLQAQMNSLSIDAFTPLELLDLQQRRETLSWQQPVIDHKVYQRLTTECTPKQLGAKSFTKVLSTRLRISAAAASRRLKHAALLGLRVGLTGEPLAPLWPTVAHGQADGLISTEHITKITSFFDKLPQAIDAPTRDGAETELAKHACRLTVDGFVTAANHLAYLLNQDGTFSDADRVAQSYFHHGKQDADGLIPVKASSPQKPGR